MCALAHILESCGLATVALVSVLGFASRMTTPRALYCEFPLGRPLGKPGDAEFQHRVLAAGFALLERTDGPVLEHFPEVIDAAEVEALACTLPPRLDLAAHPAVDEARGLRAAYDRGLAANPSGFQGERAVAVSAIPEAIAAFARIADGADWKDAGIPGNPLAVSHDIRAYYETAALALVDHTPEAWAATRWYLGTETGKVLQAARDQLRSQDAPAPFVQFLLPV